MSKNLELIDAIKVHKIDKVKELLNEKKYMDMCADVNFQKDQNNAPLHYAVEVQDLQIIKLLIQNFAELNAKNQKGQTALHKACNCGNYEIVK